MKMITSIAAVILGFSPLVASTQDSQIDQEIVHNDFLSLISSWEEAASVWKSSEAKAMLKQRNELRDLYVNAQMQGYNIEESIFYPSLSENMKEALHRRFAEWDQKLASGKLTQVESVSKETFEKALASFIDLNHEFLESDAYHKFVKANETLRDALMPILIDVIKNDKKVDTLIEILDITNTHLKNRISYEWMWKAQEKINN